jgi:glycosyltransferase involved in cell wall biosynthesis
MLSFIVPAHNEELELPGSLAAVRAAAAEAGQPYELIVVDDASTDDTAAIARQYEACVIPVNCRHIAAARNAGARAAQGDIFFFVDADTHILPAHVHGALRSLKAGCSGGSALLEMDGVVPFWSRVFLKIFCAIYFTANLGAGAFLFTRAATFRAAGGFDEQYFAGEETYLSMALKKFGPFQILHEPVVTSGRKVRMHGTAQVLRQFLAIIFSGPRALRSRRKLSLWYDGRREHVA